MRLKEIKLIIAGSRNIDLSVEEMDKALESLRGEFNIVEVVSGGARGVDKSGEYWASEMNIPIKRMVAKWDDYGKSAGPLRNRAMAQHGDALLLIWDGVSKGSASMKHEMSKLGKPVFEIVVRGDDV